MKGGQSVTYGQPCEGQTSRKFSPESLKFTSVCQLNSPKRLYTRMISSTSEQSTMETKATDSGGHSLVPRHLARELSELEAVLGSTELRLGAVPQC